MSEPLYCPVRRHYCSCHDWGDRCDVFDDEQVKESKAMKFRKKQVVIEAIQYTGENHREIMSWCGSNSLLGNAPYCIIVPTLEGVSIARPGAWVIKGIKGEFYACDADIFAATYEPAEQ